MCRGRHAIEQRNDLTADVEKKKKSDLPWR